MEKVRYHVGQIPNHLVFLDFRDEKGDPQIIEANKTYELSASEHIALVERLDPKYQKEIRDDAALVKYKEAIAKMDDSFDDLLGHMPEAPASPAPLPIQATSKHASRGR